MASTTAERRAALKAWLLSDAVGVFEDEAALEKHPGLLQLTFSTLARRTQAEVERLVGDVGLAFELFDLVQDAARAGGIPGDMQGPPAAAAAPTAAAPPAAAAAAAPAPAATATAAAAAAAAAPSAASAAAAASAAPSADVGGAGAGSSEGLGVSEGRESEEMDRMKAELVSTYPYVDEETIVEMLVMYSGDQRQVSDILANFPLPGEEPENQAAAAAAAAAEEKPTGLARLFGGAGKKKGRPKTLPGDHTEAEERVFRKLRAMKDFAGKDDDPLYAFSTTLTQPMKLLQQYFKLDDLVKHYEDPDVGLTAEDIGAARDNSDLAELSGAALEAKLRSLWRVKLILTALNLSQVQKLAGKWKKWRFGMVHAAVQVGPVVLEWGPSSVIVPQLVSQFEGTHVLLALDIGLLDTTSSAAGYVEQARILDVCRLVCQWNAQHTYSVLTRNCQHFVSGVFDCLGLKTFSESSELHKFIGSLSSGMDETTVRFTFGDRVFRTHAELDNFVSGKMTSDAFSDDDWQLLKAYDRAFWIRYLTVANGLNPTPEEREVEVMSRPFSNPDGTDGCACPFLSPLVSGTIAMP